MHSSEPMFMDLVYAVESSGEGAIPHLTFRFTVGSNPVQVWRRRQTPYLAPEDGNYDYFLLTGPRSYDLTVGFVPSQDPQKPDGIAIQVVDDTGEKVRTKKGDQDTLFNHSCFGPACAAEPMTTPWLVDLDNGKNEERAVGVEFDGLGIETGFALVGLNLLLRPRWLTATAGDLTAFNTGDCIVDPRPRPRPAPGDGGVGPLTDMTPHYDTLEFYSNGPTSSGDYAVDCYLTLDHGGIFLAPRRALDSGDRIELQEGNNHFRITYRSRFLLRDQVEVTVNTPKAKGRRFRTSVADLRPQGQFRPPRFVPLGLTEDSASHPGQGAAGLELEVFGVPTGITLIGSGLRIREGRRPESLSAPW